MDSRDVSEPAKIRIRQIQILFLNQSDLNSYLDLSHDHS